MQKYASCKKCHWKFCKKYKQCEVKEKWKILWWTKIKYKKLFSSEEVQFTQSTNIYNLHPKCDFLGWGVFSSSTKVESQNNRYRHTKNPNAVYLILLYNLKVGVWCAVSVHKNIRPAFFKKNKWQLFHSINNDTILHGINRHRKNVWKSTLEEMKDTIKRQILTISRKATLMLKTFSEDVRLA
jgi:hypothetical protein